MKEVPIFSYFAFGHDYRLLIEGREGIKIHNTATGTSLSREIDNFFDKLDELDMSVTRIAARDLRKIKKDISDLPDDATVDKDLSKRLKNAFNDLDKTLDAELQLRKAFSVTQKRFDSNYLLEEPWKFLNKNTVEALPPICIFDFRSGCRCIAFGLATAAVFHFMRCIEGLLRVYYCSMVKKSRVDPLLWGPMVQHLRNRKKSPPPKTLLDNLDNIRHNFRNPTQHPDARYDIDEAQDLLGMIIDALNRISKELDK